MPSDLFYSNESNYANSGGNQFVAYAVRAEKKIGTLRGMCLSTDYTRMVVASSDTGNLFVVV